MIPLRFWGFAASPHLPNYSLLSFLPLKKKKQQCSLLTTHKHLPLNCSEAITVVNTINGLSMSNVKPFLPEKQQWLDEIVFCALAEREAFWKVTFSANIVACEICPKKSWSYACYPKIAPSSIMPRFSAKLTHAAPGSLPELSGWAREQSCINRQGSHELWTWSQTDKSFQDPSY